MASPETHPNNPAPSIPNLRTLQARRRPASSNPQPYPETPPLPLPSGPDSHADDFETPSRRILSQKDHALFVASPTYALVRSFVFSLSESVAGVPCSSVQDDSALSDTVRAILRILDDAEALLAQARPDEQGGSRFGNRAFQKYFDLVSSRAPAWHVRLLGGGGGGGGSDGPLTAATAEVSTYLIHSFGSRTRIDYGSGHELNFVLWLLCLYQLRLLSPASDFRPLVLRVFTRYLAVVRAVQTAYYLEPAGSHGVWGLDDYQFLPFLLGASQLLGHPFITPRSVHQELTLEEFGGEYMYLGQIAYVNSTKTVQGLRWHSPMLDDISAARSWEKVEGGMRRMFVAEVLGKLPIMQHFLFGRLVPAVEGMSREDEEEQTREGEAEEAGHDGHGHGPGGYEHSYGADCCGIKVPSGVAAVEEMRKRGQGGGLRRIPFD